MNLDVDINNMIDFISTPSFQMIELIIVTYLGLLWLTIIIWVTRDAIHRSDSLIFQVISILINILFPVLGILLYLIIRPAKTTTERYYEELEHRLILESIGKKDEEGINRKKEKKKSKKAK